MIKNKYQGLAENLLFFLNIFIIFLLVFGNAIVIPQWLQPVGRLHPLVLHFPIVILIMAVMLEFFRFRERFQGEKLYHDFTAWLWLAGALFAGITALMGLFLSKEPGYEGGNLQWHKWLGTGVVFISSVIYWCRSKGWYNATTARFTSIFVIVFVTIAAHFGADITHGENFILAPVWHPEKEKVAIDKALVYRDIIQPVFVSKCNSCHNPDKTKGGLMLIDEKSILKGGKDGKLFVPGQPAISMLLQRIHLPEEDKKHMPPSGKPQLTPEELKLLYLWVKENADFSKKVISLPPGDSLRIIAATFLQPAEETAEVYDFAAAEDKLVKKLNNNYRVIYPIAQGSPALGVNIYNKNSYQPKVLEELSAIKQQVISLDVSKMPVKDAELKTIAQFENLHTLNLNFTDITGSTLKDLAPLKHLTSLSLAGTRLNPEAIKQVSAIKSLTKITLWNTGLSDAQVQALQNSNKNIEFIAGFKDDGKPIKLNNPQVKNTGFVFKDSLPLQLAHPIKGVDIRYTVDGTDPDSVKSLLYKPGIVIAKSIAIKAKAYKAGWLGSDVVSANFYKCTFTPDSISFIIPPNDKYKADGAKSLIDKDLGGTGFGNGKWIAAQKDVIIYMQFNKPAAIHQVTLNCMRNIGSQIFLPIAVEVWGGDDAAHLRLLGKTIPAAPKKDDPFMLTGIHCKLSPNRPVLCLKVIVKPIQNLPPWDPVKKQPGWFFTDELFLN